MRKSLILPSLLLFPALLASGRTSDPRDSIALRRGPCFGNCPVYEVVLRGDGTATYDGGAYAPREGRYEGRVEPEAVERLLVLLDEASFWGMEEDRQIRVQDMPQVTLTARHGRRSHRVHTNLPPQELAPVQSAIDSVAAEIEWVPEQRQRNRPIALNDR